jgi:molybdopterin molybdotransferase
LVRLKGFQRLTAIEEALQSLLNKIQIEKLKVSTIPLHQSLNRVLAEDVIAEEDLPRFDRSAVDGYALRTEDTFGASQSKPRILRLSLKNEIGDNQAKELWTGNPLPKNADAVVMLENTKQNGDKIEVWIQLTPGEGVSRKGEDIQKGEIAIEAGTRLKPQQLGLIAALGNAEAKVFEKPKIAILVTGNELVRIGDKPSKDQIFDSNSVILSALCRELGAEPMELGIIRDDVTAIIEKLKVGLKMADMVMTTGGTSVGVSDLVPEAVNRIGKPGVIVHGIAMRPGMPTALAVVDGKPIIILSGNPVAAMIAFEAFARPVICRMLGLKKEELRPIAKAKMTKRVSTVLGRNTFVRVRVRQHEGEFLADPISTRGSSIISTMTKANGYVVVPENREGLEEGELVSVHLIDSVEVT